MVTSVFSSVRAVSSAAVGAWFTHCFDAVLQRVTSSWTKQASMVSPPRPRPLWYVHDTFPLPSVEQSTLAVHTPDTPLFGPAETLNATFTPETGAAVGSVMVAVTVCFVPA